MLICPITCSGIIKLVFVRGCNYQLPWHIPSLVVCTLPQYQASNRRKHSLTTLKWARRWPRTESLYVAHFGQRTASHSSLYRVRGEKASLNTTVSKPQLCERPSTETQRGGRKYLQKETWQHREVGQPNGGGAQPKHPCLTGTDECVTWDAQGRKPTRSPARQHPQRASQLH